nr:HAD family hydrolase [Phycicoccus sp. HDW14]
MWEGLRERGLRVGVLSNTIWSRDYHREIFERDGVLDLLDADLYSSEIDHVKPHPEAFRAICRALGVEPEAAVYVGDRMFEDVHGPQQVGMRAIWVPHSTLPENQKVEVTAVPDARAHELLDVLSVVDGWLADARG